MRLDQGMTAGGKAEGMSAGDKFAQAMQSESANASATPSTAGGETADVSSMIQSLSTIMKQMKELIQQLSQLVEAMSCKCCGKSRGASSIGSDGTLRPVEGAGGPLGGTQGPSDKIPDPTKNVREVALGDKTMTIGSDGSASAAEVDAAAKELQRMYDVSPTFRDSIDGAGADELTVTLGRRGDNTSWGGGGRVFLNLNNISAGNNDRFQGIVGHEFAHAADGLGHGPELDAIEDKVRAEA